MKQEKKKKKRAQVREGPAWDEPYCFFDQDALVSVSAKEGSLNLPLRAPPPKKKGGGRSELSWQGTRCKILSDSTALVLRPSSSFFSVPLPRFLSRHDPKSRSHTIPLPFPLPP